MSKQRHKNIPASYLVLLKENKILLSRRFNTGYMDGHYSLVAGHVEIGETFTQCVIRETLEEAGLVILPQHLSVAHIMHRNSKTDQDNERIDVFFVASEWSGEIENMEEHKCDDLAWFGLDYLPENTLSYVRQAIESIDSSIYYSEHGWD